MPQLLNPCFGRRALFKFIYEFLKRILEMVKVGQIRMNAYYMRIRLKESRDILHPARIRSCWIQRFKCLREMIWFIVEVSLDIRSDGILSVFESESSS